MMRGAALGALLLVGCSDSNEPSNQNNADPCAGVVCERGSCDPGSKQCANPASCDADGQCLAGSICEAGACVDDPCTTEAGSPTCARGTCERGTGICQNAASCTPDTSGVRCLEGFVCFDRACKSEADICADLNCEARRGVCDPVAQACVAATDCAGDDRKCLAGSYCAADDTCKPNACDITMKTCARGVCDAASAECVNAASCDASDDCLDGFLCLSGTCRGVEQACGAAGCPGTQACQYNAQTLMSACVEDMQAGCINALDCVGERVCISGQCAEPQSCDADKYEPNNDDANATDLVVEDGRASATLCASDVDVYKLKVELPQGQLSSQFVWDLTLHRADVGLGIIKAELKNPQGSVVASAQSSDANGPTGALRLSYEVNPTRQGDYTLTVTGQDVLTAGVRYDVRADLVSQDVLAACQLARPITVNQLTLGDLSQMASNSLVSSCGGDTFGNKAEQVWTFTLDAPKYIEIEARPGVSSQDLALSLRGDCLRAATELDASCHQSAGPGQSEVLRQRLEAGSYTLVVESVDGPVGAYSLIFTAQDVICGMESTCTNGTERRYCAPTGTGFLTESCVNGCNVATGFCDAVSGDTCNNPIVVNPATGYSATIPIREFAAKLDPGAGSCIPNSNPSSSIATSTTESDGSDVIFLVTLQPDEALSANFTRGSQYISAYILTSCGDVNSCVAGANVSYSSNESLFYVNQTLSPQTYFVVVDSSADVSSTTSITADIRVNPYTCTPGAKRCVRNREAQTCAPDGSGYALSTSCPYGCDAATGECSAFAYDTCDGAVVLTPGVARNESLDVFSANDAPTSPCSTTAAGPDAVYLVENVPANSTVRVQMSSSFDAVLWVANSCDVATQKVQGCFQRVDSASSNGTETLEFFSATGGDYYIVADTYSAAVSSGTFSILATILPPACIPGTPQACLDATTLPYCNSLGQLINFTCSGGCADDAQGVGACGTPSGDLCSDAIPLIGPSGVTATANLQAAGRTNALTLPDGRVGSCYLDGTSDDTTGRDTFYKVELQAGELLTVTMTASNASAILHLSENCNVATSCIGYYNARPSSASAANPNVQTIRYQAQTAETIFVVVDSQLSASATTAIDYTLSWQVQGGYVCAPNTTRCLDASILESCDAFGVSSQIACAQGCQGDACLPDAAADLCATAPLLQPGSYMVMDLINANSEVSLSSSECIGLTTTGNDVFYRVDVQAGQLVTASLLSYGEETIGLALFTDCSDVGGTCLSGTRTLSTTTPPYSAEVFYLAQQAGSIYIMIEAAYTGSSADEGMGLVVDVKQPNCIPGQPTVCLDSETVQFCNARGLLDTYACGARGCSAGLCNTPTADTCFDPELLVGVSGTVSGTWNGKSALLNPGEGRHGACVFDDLDDPTGRDAVYAIDLQAGELLTAELTSVGTLTSTSWLYVLEDCQSPGTACAANHPLSGDNNRQVTYVATQPRRVFLVADTESTTTTESFTMAWSVTPNKVCAPSKWSCQDAQTVALCNNAGTGYEASLPCEDGCAGGACVLNMAAADTCGGVEVQRSSTPINGINGGFYGFFNLRGRTNDLSYAASTCGNSSSTTGYDQFITISLRANEVFTAHAITYGAEVVNLMLLGDCAGSTCIAGAQGASTLGTRTSLSYQAGLMPETIYLAVDSTTTSTDEPIGVEILLRDPNCIPGQAPACQGSDVVYCTPMGVQESYSCGVRGCNMGTCNNPTGDTCFEPILLQGASGAVSGVYDNMGSDLNPGEGVHGACAYDDADDPLGRDVVYAVDLQAGDLLAAELTAAPAAATNWIYVLEDCQDVSNTCAANHVVSGEGNRKIAYVAQQARRVYLVVDSESISQTGNFTLSWTITSNKVCAPGQYACVDATTAGLCNTTGDGFQRQYACPGACSYGTCVVDQQLADACGTAPVVARNATPLNSVSGGLLTWGNFRIGNDTASLSAQSCVGEATPGRDAFYQVNLQANEILDASVVSIGGETPALAIVQDCDASEVSCLVGDTEFPLTSLTYQAGNTPETVFVLVDSTVSSSDEPYLVELIVRAPDCTPGVTPQACNMAADGFTFCNARGFTNTYRCEGTCTNGLCDTPRADICLDPAWLNPGGMASGMYSVTGSMAGLTNDYDLVAGNACLSLSSPTNGRDAVYRVDLAAGQTMTAAVTSTAAAPEDLTLYVLPATGCASTLTTCLAGADDLDASASPETLTYTATVAQTVYIVVDSYFAATSGAFTLNVNVQ